MLSRCLQFNLKRLSVALISWAYRIGVRGDADRDAEAQARRYFDRFGRWPDERA